ncbi:MAG TPA: glycosyltransferase family 2 protein [Caulobacteraceae bacterium]|nr:glycosyltransferase family 2 protein [Caulobacteraceae bacterium]
MPRVSTESSLEAIDVSFVLPCLNEAQSLAVCIGMAREALATLSERHGLSGEIVLADNGSTDGSQALAMRLGARVAPIVERGYGAALRGGFQAARGRYLVMGDADGSYDFREAVPMIEALMDGADLCMGSRFKGGIAPGAMPWKNRYIGNPVLTGLLNVLFRTRIGDAHCGLRGFRKAAYEQLDLNTPGMEFASEMVIKAALKHVVIREVPATLSPDLRDRPPHLRPWRDGWRHLRYLFMLSPGGVFGVPALAAGAVAAYILASATWAEFTHPGEPFHFGNYWVVLAGAMLSVSHIAAILAVATHLFGVRAGYRRPKPWLLAAQRWLTLETMALSGAALVATGLGILAWTVVAWKARGGGFNDSVLPAVLGTLFVALGAQNVLGGFLLAILGGNEARFLSGIPAATPADDKAAPRSLARPGIARG